MTTTMRALRAGRTAALIIASSVVFFASLSTKFFAGDDWFHLRIIQISNTREFLNFLLPIVTPQAAAFWRPVGTQLFFFPLYQLFGLQPLPYFLVLWAAFAAGAWLFYQNLTPPDSLFQFRPALVSLIVFCFASSHFGRLNFLSTAQEVFMFWGVMATWWGYRHQRWWTPGVFCLALLSKETALITPGLLLIIDYLAHRQPWWRQWAWLAVVAASYLVARTVFFGFGTLAGSTYALSFAPKSTLLSIYFYTLWTIGGPELLQDYLHSPVSLIPRYQTDFGRGGWLTIGLLLATLLAGGVLLIWTYWRRPASRRGLLAAGGLFLLTLTPFLFFPQHRFSISLTLSIAVWAALSGYLFYLSPRLTALVVVLSLALNLASVAQTVRSHYTVQRARISRQAVAYLSSHDLQLTPGTQICLANADTPGSQITEWGSSRQVSHALWGENFWQVYYQQPDLSVVYEDDLGAACATSSLILSSQVFLTPD